MPASTVVSHEATWSQLASINVRSFQYLNTHRVRFTFQFLNPKNCHHTFLIHIFMMCLVGDHSNAGDTSLQL